MTYADCEKIVLEDAKCGVDDNGVHWCVLPYGAGALEGFGNSKEEAQSIVIEALESYEGTAPDTGEIFSFEKTLKHFVYCYGRNPLWELRYNPDEIEAYHQ